jgi:hypothetical protein
VVCLRDKAKLARGYDKLVDSAQQKRTELKQAQRPQGTKTPKVNKELGGMQEITYPFF